ncbi:hypothetical protein MmiEs2_04380 [Methanimicrococcus stummii]|uniref:DUF805 domain-containing protein n=1 Tax=Methanimicrococcus stummii TaxID=3028294 RepID=A0AA96V7P3_9EURY|nr:DUF805 domain-containing protein [Methanimicrococcus sp. Es2]WNY28254.1 hypothetical protein MmiEs2_04380 [Methanimicrococcus sp. Es2]
MSEKIMTQFYSWFGENYTSKGRANRGIYIQAVILQLLLSIFPLVVVYGFDPFFEKYLAEINVGSILSFILWSFIVLLVMGYVVFFIYVFVFYICQKIRRLHDLNMSGWWLLSYVFVLIPLIGLIYPIVFEIILLLTPGKIGPNKYGDNSLEEEFEKKIEIETD